MKKKNERIIKILCRWENFYWDIHIHRSLLLFIRQEK